MKPWLFIFTPFIIIVVLAYICGWANAFDKYKRFNDPFDIVMMAVTSSFGLSIAYGIYLLLFTQ
jgi:hypothetical protein